MNLLNISENKFYLFMTFVVIVGEFLALIISGLTIEILKFDNRVSLFLFLSLSIIFIYFIGCVCGYYEGVKYERLKGGIK